MVLGNVRARDLRAQQAARDTADRTGASCA